jgi:L-alanine-DL-glutamate epimerase-like enolase superfamily enzyme
VNKQFVIRQIIIYPLNVPLISSFNTATSVLPAINNLAIAVELADGSTGWGETPILPPVTTEDLLTARLVLEKEIEYLKGKNAGQWRKIAGELLKRIPDYAAVRCGLEMALIDAIAKSRCLPLFQFFGGHSDHVITDITIPICPADEAEQLARQYKSIGFQVIKIKVGRNIDSDIERILAIRNGYNECKLLLDANTAFTVEQTFMLLSELRKANIKPVLLEQPLQRDDWEGLSRLVREAGVPIAVDESCCTPMDAIRIVKDKLAHVINIKLAKCGVVQALEIAAIARAGNINLMIGGMVETRIAMGFSAHFAAGLGGFDWIDLDTPLLLSHDPVSGGYSAEGARYNLATGSFGHGGELKDEKTGSDSVNP